MTAKQQQASAKFADKSLAEYEQSYHCGEEDGVAGDADGVERFQQRLNADSATAKAVYAEQLAALRAPEETAIAECCARHTSLQGAKQKLLSGKRAQLQTIDARHSPTSAPQAPARAELAEHEAHARKLQRMHGPQPRTMPVWAYNTILCLFVIAEIPLTRSGFEMLYPDHRWVSLLTAGLVGMLMMTSTHVLGKQLRQARSIGSPLMRWSHYAAWVTGAAIVLLPLLWLIARMRQYYLQIMDASADQSLFSVIEHLSASITGPWTLAGITLLWINLAIVIVATVLAYHRHTKYPEYEAVMRNVNKARRKFNRLDRHYHKRYDATSQTFDECIAVIDAEVVRIDSEIATREQSIKISEAQHDVAVAQCSADAERRRAAYRDGYDSGRRQCATSDKSDSQSKKRNGHDNSYVDGDTLALQ